LYFFNTWIIGIRITIIILDAEPFDATTTTTTKCLKYLWAGFNFVVSKF
jgi:hypothetical protein